MIYTYPEPGYCKIPSIISMLNFSNLPASTERLLPVQHAWHTSLPKMCSAKINSLFFARKPFVRDFLITYTLPLCSYSHVTLNRIIFHCQALAKQTLQSELRGRTSCQKPSKFLLNVGSFLSQSTKQ